MTATRISRIAVLALLLGVAAVNFIWMPGEFLAGDPHAWREETRSLLLSGELNVPRDTVFKISERGEYFAQNERNGLYYSKFGIANSLLAAPPMWLERALGGDIGRRGFVPSLLLANLWNLVLCVALAALLYSLAAVWGCAALLVFTRILNGLLLPVIVLLAAWCAARGRSWRELRGSAAGLGAALLLPPALILVALGVVNHVKFGAPWLTGYHQWRGDSHLPYGRLADGLWGFLFAPRFSIFLYFPLLIFALVGLRRFAERHRLDLAVMLSIFAPFFLVLAKTPSWAGEWSYGPRYLLPMLPVLSLPFLAFADDLLDRIGAWRARAWAAAAIAALAYSAYLQVQVNLLPFWIYYNAREALFVSRSLVSIDYFLNRHTALIAEDLVRHRHDVEGLPYFAEMKLYAPPEFVADYRRNFGAMLERGNLYWTLPPGQRR